ncbi:MAG: PAS domain S-box protein [Acidobacteria bacterium]|nr:PAS domain S-box protein [Acidobacteriota bacterium]
MSIRVRLVAEEAGFSALVGPRNGISSLSSELVLSRSTPDELVEAASVDADVIVVDATCAGWGRTDAIRRTRALAPKLPIVALVESEEKAFVDAALVAGADELLAKTDLRGCALDVTIHRALEGFRRSHTTGGGITREPLPAASKAVAQAVVNAPGDVALLLDTGGTIVTVNAQAEHTFRATAPDLLGRCVFDLLEPDVAQSRRRVLEEVVRTGRPMRFDDSRRGQRWESSVYPIFDEQGKVVHAAVIARDVTGVKEAEEANHLLAKAVEQSAEAIFVLDRSRALRYANPAYERITGYSPAEVSERCPGILGRPCCDLESNAEIWSTLERGDVWGGHFKDRRKDGDLYEADATISPVRDASGEIVSYVGVIRDVTREMALAEQLQAEERMRALGHLAGGVAHDFNNLMQAMLGAIELLRRKGADTGVVERATQELDAHVRRGSALTRQLLLFSRSEIPQRERLDLNVVIRETNALMRRLIRENIRFAEHLAEGPIPVLADRGQIEQLLSNLVVNASDAMPQGGDLLILSGHDETGSAWLEVRDNGCGVPSELQDRIFEPFFTTKGPGRGTGLGLSVVRDIVTGHGGRIELESSALGGTAFRVVFPLASEEALTQTELPQADSSPRSSGGEHLLVVEDDVFVRGALQEMLSLLGYRVVAAANGEECADLPDHPAIDLVLTDLMLPGIGGVELVGKLRTRWPHLRAMVTSGYSDLRPETADGQSGGFRFLGKPFTLETLAREVHAALTES